MAMEAASAILTARIQTEPGNICGGIRACAAYGYLKTVNQGRPAINPIPRLKFQGRELFLYSIINRDKVKWARARLRPPPPR